MYTKLAVQLVKLSPNATHRFVATRGDNMGRCYKIITVGWYLSDPLWYCGTLSKIKIKFLSANSNHEPHQFFFRRLQNFASDVGVESRVAPCYHSCSSLGGQNVIHQKGSRRTGFCADDCRDNDHSFPENRHSTSIRESWDHSECYHVGHLANQKLSSFGIVDTLYSLYIQ